MGESECCTVVRKRNKVEVPVVSHRHHNQGSQLIELMWSLTSAFESGLEQVGTGCEDRSGRPRSANQLTTGSVTVAEYEQSGSVEFFWRHRCGCRVIVTTIPLDCLRHQSVPQSGRLELCPYTTRVHQSNNNKNNRNKITKIIIIGLPIPTATYNFY